MLTLHMAILVGLLVVFLSVFGGFAIEGGPLAVIMQPVEWMIIVGGALGGLVIATPSHRMRALGQALTALLRPPGSQASDYIELLNAQYDLFVKARRDGSIALESDLDDPAHSPVLSKYPRLLGRPAALEFLSDSLRLIMDGGAAAPFDLEMLLDRELDTHYQEARRPAQTVAKVGDTLPGLGIVAAVLGVIIAMQALDGPMTMIGHKVAVALVGTFFGVFLAYGVVNPLASRLEVEAEADLHYLTCIKGGVMAYAKQLPPQIAVEYARRVIPDQDRPSLRALDQVLRGGGNGSGASA